MSVWNYGQTKENSQEMRVNEMLILVLPKAVAWKRSSLAGATWLYWKQRRVFVMGNLLLSSLRVWLCWCTEQGVSKPGCSSVIGKEIGLVSNGAVQWVDADWVPDIHQSLSTAGQRRQNITKGLWAEIGTERDHSLNTIMGKTGSDLRY